MAKPKPIVYQGTALDLHKAKDRVTLSELTTAAIRMRNRGATCALIADKLGLTEPAVEHILEEGIRRLATQDAISVRGRQQALIHDLYNALYPSLEGIDEELRIRAAGTIKNVLEYEGKLHGATAPQKVQIGMDQETFTTRVEEDLREIGIDPKMDVALEEDDGTWANT